MSLFPAVACNVTRISGIETLPQVLNLQIFNAQIPLGEHMSHPRESNVPYITNWQDVCFAPSVTLLRAL